MATYRNHLTSRLTGLCLAVFLALSMISLITTTTWAEEAKEAKEAAKVEAAEKAEAKINLNTATVEELDTLPDIGRTKAAAIIKYREENGPFKTIEDIQKVKGIAEGIFKKIKDLITV